MKVELEMPSGVSLALSGNELTIKGKITTLKRVFPSKLLKFNASGNTLTIEGVDDRAKTKAQLRATEKHVSNMINGSSNKYKYKLVTVYSHFPITVAVKGSEVHITNFLGEREPRIIKLPQGVSVNVKGKDITVESSDKDAAGRIAGLLESSVFPRNRDRRIYQDGVYIVEKGALNE